VCVSRKPHVAFLTPPYTLGTTRSVSFQHPYGASAAFDIAWSANSDASWSAVTVLSSVQSSSLASYTVTLSAAAGTTGVFRVSVSGGSAAAGAISVPIAVAAPFITVASPNSSSTWTIGVATNITWTHNLGPIDTVTVSLSRSGGAYAVLVSGVSSTCTGSPCSRAASVIPAAPAAASALVQVAWTGHATSGTSSAFSIS
jgi:hypothetical protein